MSRNLRAMDLALRDSALASLMGALSDSDRQGGADFGSDPYADFGAGPFDSAEYADQTVAVPMHPAIAGSMQQPHPAAMAAAWQAHSAQQQHTQRRVSLLNPNANSSVKVERYSFSLTQPLVLNVAIAGFNTTLQPNAKIRPQRVIMNAPSPNFVLLNSMQVANVNVFIGATEDAYNYTALAQGVVLDLPTLESSSRATVSGSYTGFVPPGYANNFPFLFVVTFQGPSSMGQ